MKGVLITTFFVSTLALASAPCLNDKVSIRLVRSNPITAIVKVESGVNVVEDSISEESWLVSHYNLISRQPSIYQDNKKYFISPSNQNDPHIKFMKWLGFKFGENIHIPRIRDAFQKVDDALLEPVRLGEASIDHVFRPVLIYEFPDGTIVPRFISEAVPTGAKPCKRVLNSREYLGLVAKGLQPVGLPDASINYKSITATSHDFAHLGVYKREPDYVKAIRSKLNDFDRNGQLDKLAENKKWMERFGVVTESLELVNKKSWPSLRKILSTMVSDPDQPVVDLNLLRADLSRKKSEGPLDFHADSVQALREIRNHWNDFFTAYGGTAADVGPRYNLEGIRAGQFQVIYRDIMEKLRKTGDVDPNLLGDLYGTIINARHLSVEEVISDLLQIEVKKESKFSRLMCESLVYHNGSAYRRVCP